MKIDFLPVPVYQGCNIKGVDMAPEYFLKNGAAELFGQRHEVTLLPAVHFRTPAGESPFAASSEMKFRDEMLAMTVKICSRVSASIRKGHFPITFGGDHSVGTGTICGCSKSFGGQVSAIWFDAHPDINTPKTSPSKNFHGMSFATAMGYGDEQISNVGFKGAKVKSRNAYLAGIRAIDQGEQALIDEQGIVNFKSADFRAEGPEVIADRILQRISQSDAPNIHFSIDVDVISPEEMEAVNVPEKEGIDIETALVFIRKIVSCPMVRSLDFVEYNPLLDPGEKSFHNCMRMLETISEALSERKTEKSCLVL